MDVVRLEDAQGWCADYESTLRSSFGAERRLPEEWEAALAQHSVETLPGAISRWALLKHYYLVQQERKASALAPEAAQHAVAALLRREPVAVALSSGRIVRVTGRSILALMEMAAHEAALQLLEARVTDGQQLYERLASARETADRRRRRALSRRMRTVRAALGDLYDLLAGHRERWCAHLATPDGAPALPTEPAPEWWREITHEDTLRLLLGCYEAGPARYETIGSAPAPRKGSATEPAEWFGALSILGAYGLRIHVAPAELMRRDYGQLLAELRLFPSPSLAELE